MPLIPGKSKKAFSKNVETEMNAGKPQKQSLAIAYSMKKKKKLAHGSGCKCPACCKNMADGGDAQAPRDDQFPDLAKDPAPINDVDEDLMGPPQRSRKATKEDEDMNAGETGTLAYGGDASMRRSIEDVDADRGKMLDDIRQGRRERMLDAMKDDDSNEEHEHDRHDDMGEPMMAKGGKLGSGERFAKLKGKLAHEKGVTNPGALAASIGRKKYGAHKMAKMAAHGKEHHAYGGYADGGDVGPIEEQNTDNYNSPDTSMGQTKDGMVDPQETYTRDHEGNFIRVKHAAETEDDRDLNQHGAEEQGPYGTMMAEGGQITDNYSDTEDGDGEDMVGRIMKQRQAHYSEGGRVANEDHGPNENRLAGFDPNEFDDLELRDDLEQHDTGANSGDEDSDPQEDSDRKDIVSRIMKSRAKKDRLPKLR